MSLPPVDVCGTLSMAFLPPFGVAERLPFAFTRSFPVVGLQDTDNQVTPSFQIAFLEWSLRSS